METRIESGVITIMDDDTLCKSLIKLKLNYMKDLIAKYEKAEEETEAKRVKVGDWVVFDNRIIFQVEEVDHLHYVGSIGIRCLIKYCKKIKPITVELWEP